MSRSVGFDLDLTLIDTRPGIAAVYRALVAETGVDIDVDGVLSRVGSPLDTELARWFPPSAVPAMANRYRELYGDAAIAVSPLLPGVVEAIETVHRAGATVIVITSKNTYHATLHIGQFGLAVDEVIGGAFGEGKRDALVAQSAVAYVGDYPADMVSARAAGVLAVGVTTGHTDTGALRACGADVVLSDLREFPDWWADAKPLGTSAANR